MTSVRLGFAVAVLRAWTRVYTWRLDPLLRERRRAEIESDLWECQQDPAGNRGITPASQLLARMVMGVPDDLAWRAEYLVVEDNPHRRVIALTTTMAAIVVAAFWFGVDTAGAVAETAGQSGPWDGVLRSEVSSAAATSTTAAATVSCQRR